MLSLKIFLLPTSNPAVSSCRKLHLESLENRELLSVNPLYYNGNVTSPYEITNSSITATLNDAASVALYAKFTTPSDLSGFNYILAHDGTSNQSDELFLRIRDGKIQFGAWHNPFNELVEYEVLANQKYTVFGVFDDTNNSNSLKLYVNSANNPVSGYSGVDIADIKNYTSFSPKWYVGRHGTAATGWSVPDRTFDIEVEITLGGTATPGNNGSTGDYHLTLSPNGGVASNMITISDNKAIVTIPAGQSYLDFYVMPNGDSVFELDETVVLTVSKAYIAGTNSSFALHRLGLDTNVSGTVTIYQAPEFLSDGDAGYSGTGTLNINGDAYFMSIAENAGAGTAVVGKTTIHAEAHRNVTYVIEGDNSNGLFQINASTGIVTSTRKMTLAESNQQHNLTIKVYDNTLADYLILPSNLLYDVATTVITPITFDLDIDSDNYANGNPSFGTRAMPERSDREEFYEKNDYGLGKVIIPNWSDADQDGILDCWDGYQQGSYNQTTLGNGARSELFYPIVLEIPQEINLADMRIKFDYSFASTTPTNGTTNPPVGGDGTIRIWTKDGTSARNALTITAGGDLVMSTGTTASYTPAQLGFTNSNRTIVLYVEGVRENSVAHYEENDWKNVYQNVKPTTSIKVTLEYNGVFLAEDEVRYIVSHSNPSKSQTASFWYNVLAHEEFRQAFASTAIYSRENLPRFGMQLLQHKQLVEMGIDYEMRQLLLNDIPGNFWTTIAGQQSAGFNAGIYYDHITGKAILTFAGTDLTDLGDWIADVQQGIALSDQQYNNALQIARNLLTLYGSGTAYTSLGQSTPGKPTGIMITGHSLGGGLASAATVVSGFSANTFNAAGLSSTTILLADLFRFLEGYAVLANPGTLISAYIAENDVLDAVQWLFGIQALGNRIVLQDENLFTALEAHGMWQILYGLMYKYNYV